MVNKINQISQTQNVRQMQLNNAAASQCVANSFEALLHKQLDKNSNLQFSRHATERVAQRGIEMTESFLGDLELAVEKARQKGAKDVVVISDRGAFIVNVPNNTVVTTMSGSEMKDSIFTNIDSAVLL